MSYDKKTMLGVLAFLLCTSLFATVAAAAEIPGLTDLERQNLLLNGRSDQEVPGDAVTVEYVAPGLQVMSRVVPSGGPMIDSLGDLRRYIDATRPSLSPAALLTNGRFEDGSFNGWTLEGNLGTGMASVCGAPWPADAFILTPALLPFTNFDPCLNAVYEGQYAAMLGDEVAWGYSPGDEPQCSFIYQDFTNPAGNTAFSFAYAVIASNPYHGFGQDPYFEVRVDDLTAGMNLYDVIDYTTSYDPANPCNPWCHAGVIDPNTGDPIVYRCWTTITMNLGAMAGHTIRVSLLASDCSPSAHFCEGFLDGVNVGCPDSDPPAAVTLNAGCLPDPAPDGSYCAELSWLAPEDPTQVPDPTLQQCVPGVGPAAYYDIRWSLAPITDANFAMANQVSGEPVPAAPGTPETFQFCGLPPMVPIYIALRSVDGNFNESPLAFAETRCGNHDPDCSGAYPSTLYLWPPNHQMIPVEILGVTDEDGDPITINVVHVEQDEPLNTLGDGNTCPDAFIYQGGEFELRAERSGTKKVPGNGRVYRVFFVADDGRGGTCRGAVRVCVPHDMGKKECVDDGLGVNSLGPCPMDTPVTPGTVDRVTPGAWLNVDLGEGASRTRISYSLAEPSHVLLRVFDVTGRSVGTLVDAQQGPGQHAADWRSLGLPSGLFYVRIDAGSFTQTQRLVVVN